MKNLIIAVLALLFPIQVHAHKFVVDDGAGGYGIIESNAPSGVTILGDATGFDFRDASVIDLVDTAPIRVKLEDGRTIQLTKKAVYNPAAKSARDAADAAREAAKAAAVAAKRNAITALKNAKSVSAMSQAEKDAALQALIERLK